MPIFFLFCSYISVAFNTFLFSSFSSSLLSSFSNSIIISSSETSISKSILVLNNIRFISHKNKTEIKLQTK